MEPLFATFFFLIGLAILFRVLAGGMDGDRVEAYVREQGWELVDRSWDPFGPGWFGEKDARIYQIVYRDGGGHLHRAHVKTSMFSGVYLTQDRIVEAAEVPQETGAATDASALDARALADENERLRARVAELERGS